MEDSPRVAVRAIITNKKNQILLLQRTDTAYYDDYWNLPGGKVDYGDTVLKTLIKEVKEETELIVEDATFLQYLDNPPDEGSSLHFVTLVFIANVNGTIRINGESSAYAWVGKAKLKNYKIAFRNEEAMMNYWESATPSSFSTV